MRQAIAEKSISAIHEQMDRYHGEKPQGEICLVSEIRRLLIESGQGANVQYFDNHPRIVEATGKIADVQRYCINQFWHVQLGACEKNSFNERSMLLERGPFSEWLSVFRQGIIPFIIENDLPRPLED